MWNVSPTITEICTEIYRQPTSFYVLLYSDAPEIEQAPGNLTVPVGSPATFTCVAGGNPPPDITWLFNSVVIPGAEQSTYTIAMVTGGDAGEFSCVATNSISIAHESATLTPLCESKLFQVL